MNAPRTAAVWATMSAGDDADPLFYCSCELETELQAAHSRIKELETQVENLEARGIHTCHDHCERPLCVANRRIKELEAMHEALSDIVTTEHESKDSFIKRVMETITQNKTPTKHPEAKPQ